MLVAFAATNPATILIITAILLAIIAVVCVFVYRTEPTHSAHHARERAMRGRGQQSKLVDPWSPVPYEPEALNRKLAPADVKPPARFPVWRGHDPIPASEQERIESRVQDVQSAFLGRSIAREVQLSDTEFSRLFPSH
ncbi:hypothetical protein D3C71_78810 [compost metagenome]